MIKDNLKKSGYYTSPDVYTLSQITYLTNELNRMSVRRTPLNENNKSVWWDEINIPQSGDVAMMILDKSLRQQIEAEFSVIQDAIFWANRYRLGEYIPKHCDTDGDLQIILPLLLPPKTCGGDLLLHHQNDVNIVSQAIGQRIVFQAIKTPHETTSLTSSPVCRNPVRIVCIGRIFF
jgi:hypothetical protein